MDIGIYFDLRNPLPWQRPWADVYASAIEQIEEAEHLGIGSVWSSEHHFFEDGYLPQPLTFAAAVSARTQRLRIGTSIMIAGLRPSVDIAEQAAVVDLISNGRLELGLGAGYRAAEFDAYGSDLSRRFPLLEERVREVRELWDNGGVTPAPVQERPPIWVGGHGPRAARIAGRTGEGLLSLQPESLPVYRKALVENGHEAANARVSSTVNMIVADDPEKAWQVIKPHLAHQWRTYREGTGSAGRVQVQPGAITQALDAGDDPESLRSQGPVMNPPNFDVVTAEEAIRRLRLWLGEMPVVHGYFWASIAGMPADLANRHVQLLATEVAPAVADLGLPS